MNDGPHGRAAPRRGLACAILCGLFLGLLAAPKDAWAVRVILKSGFEMDGDEAPLGSMIANQAGGDSGGRLIVFVDDGLRRTYVSLYQVKQIQENADEKQQTIKVPQPITEGGRPILALGPFAEKPTEINEFGRRTIRINLADGQGVIQQAVTLITPRYYQLQTLNAGQRLMLDQRYATSNLTSLQLSRIIDFAMKDQKPEARLDAVRLYLQADRYPDAQRELEALQKSQPQMKGLAEMIQELRQFQATTVLRELRLRAAAGQHQLVRGVLEHFPSEGVAGQTQFEVRKMLEQYADADKQLAAVKQDLKDRLARVKDDPLRKQLTPLVDEICKDLSPNNMPRLAAYRRLGNDPALSEGEKLSLAVSGWLVGTEEATNTIAASQSLLVVREIVRQFFNEPLKAKRGRLIDELRSQQSASPKLIARLLACMKPCVAPPEEVKGAVGYYEIVVPGRDKEPDATYYVQVPPEYDPYRRYPAILTLHGEATDGPKQVDWWSGAIGPTGVRQGQAMRQGYIVIAPQWTKEGQRQYEYSAREHTVVLDVLRDACRRFSIDTDRVFLTGHGSGGDAAWDMGLAHPDQWAGVIPIVATADSNKYWYNKLYWQNGRYVPLYFVAGQLDGVKMAKNAMEYDRYLLHNHFDATVVEFLGRGHESFSDEIVRIFDWTALKKRDFFPKEIECATIRSFDNYFWWIEINGFPPGVTLDPDEWPGRSKRTLKITGSIRPTEDLTTIYATTGRGPTTIWLAPELVDFGKRIRIKVAGHADINNPRPDLEVILDDVRTRGDRQHPFWARVDCQ